MLLRFSRCSETRMYVCWYELRACGMAVYTFCWALSDLIIPQLVHAVRLMLPHTSAFAGQLGHHIYSLYSHVSSQCQVTHPVARPRQIMPQLHSIALLGRVPACPHVQLDSQTCNRYQSPARPKTCVARMCKVVHGLSW